MSQLTRCINCQQRGTYVGAKTTYCAVCLVEEGYVVYDEDDRARVVKPFPVRGEEE